MQSTRTIENRGWAGLFRVVGEDEVEIEDASILATVHGTFLDTDDFAHYLQDGGPEQQQLYDIGVRGGTLSLKFDAETSRLYCVVAYTSPRELSDAESAALRQYSDEQLMDGAGSNPIDLPALGEGYFVHLGNE